MAQFDTSIYATARPKSVAEFDAEADAADARKLTGQSNRLHLLLQQRQVRDAQRAEDDQNRLLTTLRGLPATATDEDRINALRGGAFFNQADALEKSSLDRKKTTADIGKTGAETTGKQAETLAKTAQTYRDQLPLVTSPQAAAQWLQGQFSDPVLGAHMRSMGTFEEFVKRIPQEPKAFEQWRQQAGMGMDKFVADQTARRGQDVTATTSRANNAATVAATVRGQNMTDARARETHAATVTKPFEVTSKPMTEGQAKANLFGTRMQEAHDILGKMEAAGVTRPSLIKQGADAVPLIGGALGMAANAVVASPGQQQVEQAQRDFINAVLRRESGAAIAESEFKNADKQYFPQPGDASEVIAQKKRNRETAIQGLMAEVPVGARSKPKAQATPIGGAPAGQKNIVVDW